MNNVSDASAQVPGHPAPVGHVVDRRTFLKLVGASGALLLIPRDVLGQEGQPLVVDQAVDRLASDLDYDPERIFRFVADEIRYDPYSGMLRGGRGVVASGAGNSVDQAVLLAQLLASAGVLTRYAVGPIDDAIAESMGASTMLDLQTARQVLSDAMVGHGPGQVPMEGTLAGTQVPGDIQANIERGRTRGDEVVGWARGELTDTVATLEQALGEAGITLGSNFAGVPQLERSQHVWVQAFWGPGWVDLDPSVPDATWGQRVGGEPQVVEALPDALRHLVRFAVIAEHATDQGLTEEVLLERTQEAAGISGLPIGVINLPLDGVKGLGVRIQAALEGGTVYVPVLVLGQDATVASRSIRIGGGGGGPLDSASPDPAKDLVTPTAQWVELTLVSPGAEPVTVRRPIFDRLGPAARAAYAADPSTVAPEPVTLVELRPGTAPEYLPALTTHWLSLRTGPMGGRELERLIGEGTARVPMTAPVQLYHLLRDAADGEVALPSGLRTVLDAPNVASLTMTRDMLPDGSAATTQTLDLWHRSTVPVAVTGTPPLTSPALVGGVLAHVVERLLAGDALPDLRPVPAPVASVGQVFDVARSTSIPLRVLADPDQVSAVEASPDALQRLRTRLGQGLVAVVPERPVTIGGQERTGWWLIDPETGRAADEMDDGRGAVEEGVVLVVEVESADYWAVLGTCAAAAFVICAGILAGIALAVDAGGGAVGSGLLGSGAGAASGLGGWNLALCVAG